VTEPIRPDVHQQRVVDVVASAGHGPLLVLAGPGTGKTTTLVEAIAARVAAGTSPERVLTLTFSRRAAADLRARLAHRLQRTVGAPLAWTFHGFGFSLVGELLVPDDLGRALRLLSGPEQEVVVRELLAHDREIGRVAWPDHLGAALRTRGFTEQVRTFMATARSLGLDADDVASLAPDREDWRAAATFMVEYLDVMDSRGLLDYSELIVRAVAYAESEAGRARLRERYDLVVVDEYQDTDPAQERLLQAIAGDGRDLVVVGDPDQSIYAFRGADVRGITEFPARFLRASGERAPILTLRTSRRCAEAVLRASRGVAAVLGPAGSLPVDTLRQHRRLTTADGQSRGEVEVRLAPTAEREAAVIAETLRREHLHHGTPWGQMAVLVRSGMTEIPTLQRALVAGGVPVEVAGDELPLRDHPVLSPLLTVLEVALDDAALTPDVAHQLLLSPLGGASPSELRRLGRALRDQRRATQDTDPAPSQVLVRDSLLEPALLQGLPQRAVRHAGSLAALLASARAAARSGSSAHEILWSMWEGAPWAHRLVRDAEGEGPDAETAHRALDAVVALFDLAARSHERNPHGDLALFAADVLAQEVPAGPTFDVGVPGRGVRLMTAHRSKGLEWDVVVVCGLQADRWPDLRHRGSVLQADLLGPQGERLPTTPAEVRREERRLFYVATTRARRRLLCTAVEAPSDDGARPSPFLDDLDVPVTRDDAGTGRPLTLAGVTAELRAVVLDDQQKPQLRAAAATRLAALAAARGADGRRLAPAADPARWWGLAEVTDADAGPASGRALRLSGSQVETLLRCPLQWYLARRVGAEPTRGTAAGFGGVVHALADAVARGALPPDVDALTAALDSVWGQLQYAAAWEADQERQAAVAALARFVQWHTTDRGRELVASEREFSATFTVEGQSLELRGRVDRLERDTEGNLVVVDLKTMAKPPTAKAVQGNLQLATYRALVERDDDLAGDVGAAELVQLRAGATGEASAPKVQRQEATEELAAELDQALERAVTTIATGAFRATPGAACAYCPFTASCPALPSGQAVVP
jgi:superfamily I DNA/RNA helicase/RecB family exonuclease